MTHPRFAWSPLPIGAPRAGDAMRAAHDRIAERIAAARTSEDPARLHTPATWPPPFHLAPLADLALGGPGGLFADEPPDTLFADRIAEGAPDEVVLPRGTALEPLGHVPDRWAENLETDAYEILAGPLRARRVLVACGGRWSFEASIANALLARADDPVFADASAGIALVSNLRAIVDDVRAAVASDEPSTT